jgi:hypothetical protein
MERHEDEGVGEMANPVVDSLGAGKGAVAAVVANNEEAPEEGALGDGVGERAERSRRTEEEVHGRKGGDAEQVGGEVAGGAQA